MAAKKKQSAQTAIGQPINDPGTYAAMAIPRPKHEVVASFENFLIDVRKARAVHRIADVHTVLCGETTDSGPIMVSGHTGDTKRAPAMLATALESEVRRMLGSDATSTLLVNVMVQLAAENTRLGRACALAEARLEQHADRKRLVALAGEIERRVGLLAEDPECADFGRELLEIAAEARKP